MQPGSTFTLQLAGSGQQYVNIGGPGNGGPDNLDQFTGSMTVEAWIYPTYNGNAEQAIVCKDGGGDGGQGNRQFSLLITNDSQVQFWYTPPGGFRTYIPSGVIRALNTWTHWAYTFDAAGTITIYMNGAGIGAKSGLGPISIGQTNAGVKVGASGYTNIGNFFQGNIGYVRLWNTVRTPAQIAASFMKTLSDQESGLVADVQLNNSYQDTSPNHYSVSPSGLPVFTTNVPFIGTTTSTSTSTSSTSTSSSTTTTSTSTSTTITTSTSTTTTSTSTTHTTTSTSSTTSTTTTLTSTSTSTTTSTSTSTTVTVGLRFMVEKVR